MLIALALIFACFATVLVVVAVGFPAIFLALLAGFALVFLDLFESLPPVFFEFLLILAPFFIISKGARVNPAIGITLAGLLSRSILSAFFAVFIVCPCGGRPRLAQVTDL